MPFKKNTRKKSGKEIPIFTGFLRGVGKPPMATVQSFPTPDEHASDPRLGFAWPNGEGKIFLGLANADVRENTLDDGRVVRAATGGQLIGYGDDRHLCTVAGNRSGKGRSLIINNLLTYPGSVLVIDPKCDLAVETARHRARALGQKVFVLDPFDAACGAMGEFISSFNPLQWIASMDVDSIIISASLIADALVVGTNQNEPHWDDTARQFLEAVILHVCTATEFEGDRTLSAVYRVVAADVENKAFTDRMGTSTAANDAVAIGALALISKPEKERASVISTLRRHLQFLKHGQMQTALRDGPFDLGMLQREPVTLYLSLPAMMMGSCPGWLRLFVNLTLNAFEANQNRRAFQHQKGGHRLLMILDEAAILGRMERLEKAVGQIAGLGVKLWTFWQDLGQCAALYGQRWESFIGNASVLTFFGNNDTYTLEYIEKRLGQTLVYSPSHHSPTLEASTKHGELGGSYTVQSHPLMTTPEIARFFDRDDPFLRQLVFLPGTGPVILQRAFYDLHEFFCRIRGESP